MCFSVQLSPQYFSKLYAWPLPLTGMDLLIFLWAYTQKSIHAKAIALCDINSAISAFVSSKWSLSHPWKPQGTPVERWILCAIAGHCFYGVGKQGTSWRNILKDLMGIHRLYRGGCTWPGRSRGLHRSQLLGCVRLPSSNRIPGESMFTLGLSIQTHVKSSQRGPHTGVFWEFRCFLAKSLWAFEQEKAALTCTWGSHKQLEQTLNLSRKMNQITARLFIFGTALHSRAQALGVFWVVAPGGGGTKWGRVPPFGGLVQDYITILKRTSLL